MRYVLVAALFVLAACGRDETIYSYGGGGHTWTVETVNGAPFEAQATLVFEADGVVRGSAPCNTFSTTQTVLYPWIEFGPIAATRRACPALSQETAFFNVLGKVTTGVVRDDILILSNDDGDEVTFSKAVATAD